MARTARKNRKPNGNEHGKSLDRHPRVRTATELAQRLTEAALQLQSLRSSDALYAAVVDQAARLCSAKRLLLVVNGPDGLHVAGSQLPRGEDARTLLGAITPWLSEAQRTRAPKLWHGPDGAK